MNVAVVNTRSGRQLPDGDSIHELRIGQPSAMHNKVCAEKRQQNVSTSKHHRANFQEHQEKRTEAKRSGASGGSENRSR